MDIDSATPTESRIKAFVFDTYATFTLFGHENELRLCIGITKPELEFTIEHGSEKLLALLKRHGVYPFTDLEAIPCRLMASQRQLSRAFARRFGLPVVTIHISDQHRDLLDHLARNAGLSVENFLQQRVEQNSR